MNKLTSEVNHAKKGPSKATIFLLSVLGLIGGRSGRLFANRDNPNPFPVASRHRRWKPAYHRQGRRGSNARYA